MRPNDGLYWKLRSSIRWGRGADFRKTKNLIGGKTNPSVMSPKCGMNRRWTLYVVAVRVIFKITKNRRKHANIFSSHQDVFSRFLFPSPHCTRVRTLPKENACVKYYRALPIRCKSTRNTIVAHHTSITLSISYAIYVLLS